MKKTETADAYRQRQIRVCNKLLDRIEANLKFIFDSIRKKKQAENFGRNE